MISRRTVLMFSGLVSLAIVVVDLLGTSVVCGGRQYTQCMQIVHFGALTFLPLIAVFVIAVAMSLFSSDRVYQSWFRFARWWIPMSMLAIFIAPKYSGNVLDSIEKGSVALVTSVIFIVVSLIIIGYKLVRK